MTLRRISNHLLAQLRRSTLVILCAAAITSLPAHGRAASLCVQLENDARSQRSVAVAPGSNIRLRFRHSIYGSQVEEVFLLRTNGFQLTQLRYAERRLVDFYGHEAAGYDNGTWVVTPAPVLLSALDLKLSAEASMSVHFDQHPNAKQFMIPPGSALRLTVASCKNTSND